MLGGSSNNLISPSESLRRTGFPHRIETETTEENPAAVDLTEVKATVFAMLDKIRSGEAEEIKQGVTELRLLSKDVNNRIVISGAGSISLVVSLLCSTDAKVQVNAVTVLLNLSISSANRIAIMEEGGALESIAEVLRAGMTCESRENAAALLSSLLIVDAHREVIGTNYPLLESLRDLLHSGRAQGKKDALKAIFHLALWPQNRARLVMAGVLSPLKVLLGSPRPGLVEDTLAVLAQVARCKEGTQALGDPRTISSIVGFLRHGSRMAKENAASLLLALCDTGGIRVQNEVRTHKEDVVGVLCTLLTAGSSRAKAKANELMKIMVVSGPFNLASARSV